MECEIVIRAARPQDREARAELIEEGVTSYDKDAIIFFILQEVMLQACVLAGAVLFIFVGAGPGAVALVPPALAALAAGAVLLAHRAAAHAHQARMRREEAGFVAEYRGALAADASALRPRIVAEGAGAGGGGGGGRARLVGTVSVSEYRGARRAGWVHALSVARGWRRRGVGGALLTAVRTYAVEARLESLELAASALQTSARSLLHSHGWELRGTYHRQLLGSALTLPMVQMGLELPHA